MAPRNNQKLAKPDDAKTMYEEAVKGAEKDELLLKLAKRRLAAPNPRQ